MTATDLISKTFRTFDEETDSKYEQDGDRTTALDYLNDGYLDVCIVTKCSRTNGTVVTTVNNRETNQPAGAVGIVSISYPAEYRFLDPVPPKKILINQTGCPSGYRLKTTKIEWDVIPNAAYTFDVDYVNGPSAELTLTDEPSLIPEIWQPRILPYYVLWQLFATDKREEVLARTPFWKSLYEEKLNKMKLYFNGGQYAGRRPDWG